MKKTAIIFPLLLIWGAAVLLVLGQAQAEPPKTETVFAKGKTPPAPFLPKNVALHEGVTGPFNDPAKVTDSIIDKKSFAVPQKTNQPKLELMISLRGPAYIDRVVIYGNAALKKCPFEVKGSLDIFNWEPFGAGTFGNFKGFINIICVF